MEKAIRAEPGVSTIALRLSRECTPERCSGMIFKLIYHAFCMDKAKKTAPAA